MHTQRTPRLAEALDRQNITVLPIDYECVELGGGGIHCSTAPLARDPI
jgi:N-dimethylarginine dimethylaminohydrolase